MIMFISVPFDAEKSIIHSLRQNAVIFHHNVVNFQPQLHKNFSTKFFITSKQKYNKISTLNVVNFQSETWWFLYKKNEVIFLHKKQEIPNSKIGKRYIAECGTVPLKLWNISNSKCCIFAVQKEVDFQKETWNKGCFYWRIMQQNRRHATFIIPCYEKHAGHLYSHAFTASMRYRVSLVVTS